MDEEQGNVNEVLEAESGADDVTCGKRRSVTSAITHEDDREVDVVVACTDDDARTIVGLALQYAGWRVHMETSAAAVVDLALDWHPLLVVISHPTAADERCTVTEALRANQRTQSIPILNVTGHAFPAELERARAAGVTTSLIMPVSPVAVVHEVWRLIGPPE